ncbi:hypothetical protein AB1Y20_014001 [Prymnesium parvum]|uniref:Endonuclease/exonuclease/phosphatase domain-containing protein n=1 Tax=Prymnesium parvum TaxID=97485 RepID=A0AB34IH24_PRYPA
MAEPSDANDAPAPPASAARERASSYRFSSPACALERHEMVSLYVSDVRRLCACTPPPPPHPAEALPAAAVRLLTWNLNLLLGADGEQDVAASDVFALLESLDADVLVLQEVPVDKLNVLWAAWSDKLAAPMTRVRMLDALLCGAGYSLHRTDADNPTLLATRLQVVHTETFALDEEPTVTLNGGERWTEARGALYAELRIPANGSTIAVYATHLHHKDHDEVHGEGIRLREARRILAHWRQRAPTSAAAACWILADFNQPRRDDYSADEWRVVAEGLTSAHVAQPECDLVQQAMRAEGFVSSFEAAATNNFGGRPAPVMTHWTGTTVDFAYFHCVEGRTPTRITGAYVCYSDLSDHLPVVSDATVGP